MYCNLIVYVQVGVMYCNLIVYVQVGVMYVLHPDFYVQAGVMYCNPIVYVQVGVMYCRASQQTEEEMYNNEEGGPAFNEFLDLIGQRIRLKGFNKYKAGLCNKSK